MNHGWALLQTYRKEQLNPVIRLPLEVLFDKSRCQRCVLTIRIGDKVDVFEIPVEPWLTGGTNGPESKARRRLQIPTQGMISPVYVLGINTDKKIRRYRRGTNVDGLADGESRKSWWVPELITSFSSDSCSRENGKQSSFHAGRELRTGNG
jgi:hypothetical protein